MIWFFEYQERFSLSLSYHAIKRIYLKIHKYGTSTSGSISVCCHVDPLWSVLLKGLGYLYCWSQLKPLEELSYIKLSRCWMHLVNLCMWNFWARLHCCNSIRLVRIRDDNFLAVFVGWLLHLFWYVMDWLHCTLLQTDLSCSFWRCTLFVDLLCFGALLIFYYVSLSYLSQMSVSVDMSLLIYVR